MSEQQETIPSSEAFNLPVKRVGIFNKSSGVLVGMMNADCKDQINETYFNFREIELDESTQKFVGDYETGQVVDIDSAPVDVTETQLNHACGVAIENVYPVHRQVNAMVGLMKAMVEQTGIKGQEVDEFNKVFDFIAGRRKLNEKFKKAYQTGPDWNYMSTEDEAAHYGKAIEGGVHEDMGPRSLAYMPCGLDGD